ncbi:MAG: DUF1285 domain-containing protein [Alphaproteobacteria bacterium]|nr:MAG: DUF1285 domain-containing protein [Alphaproteobacteria bacterium]
MSNANDPKAQDPKAVALANLIATLQAEAGLEKPRSLPPVHLWNPANCGDIGLEIRRDGSWWQNGVRFSRDKLVRLFSTILRKDSDGYYLVTPHEKVVVKVEDAPFMGVRADRHEQDGHQVILVTTNVGDVVAVDADHPLRVVTDRQTGEPSTYVLVRGGLAPCADRRRLRNAPAHRLRPQSRLAAPGRDENPPRRRAGRPDRPRRGLWCRPHPSSRHHVQPCRPDRLSGRKARTGRNRHPGRPARVP